MHTQPALPLGWCQRWRDRRHSWRHISEDGFDRRRYECVPVPAAQVRPFVGQHHYAGAASWPAVKLAFGMYEAGELVGAAVLGIRVRAEVLTGPFPSLIPYEESAELARLVLLDRVPANAETHLLFCAELHPMHSVATAAPACQRILAPVGISEATPRELHICPTSFVCCKIRAVDGRTLWGLWMVIRRDRRDWSW